jgi:hypothetical protein
MTILSKQDAKNYKTVAPIPTKSVHPDIVLLKRDQHLRNKILFRGVFYILSIKYNTQNQLNNGSGHQAQGPANKIICMTLKLIALRLVGSLQTSSQLGAPLPRLLQRNYENMSCANICNRDERGKKKESGNSAGRRTGNMEKNREKKVKIKIKKDVDPPGCARTNSGVCFHTYRE